MQARSVELSRPEIDLRAAVVPVVTPCGFVTSSLPHPVVLCGGGGVIAGRPDWLFASRCLSRDSREPTTGGESVPEPVDLSLHGGGAAADAADGGSEETSTPTTTTSTCRQTHPALLRGTYSVLGDRSFSAAGPRQWNDLPPGLKRPRLTFYSFGQSMKTDLFGDRSA